MRNFVQWLENQSKIFINDRKFQNLMQQEAQKMIALMHDHAEKIRAFQPEQFLQKIKTQLANYPELNQLLQALQSKNANLIFNQQTKLRDWLMNQDFRQTEHLRSLSREIFSYVDAVNKSEQDVNEQEIYQIAQKAVQDTAQNMLKIKELIEQAVSRIPNWNDSVIVIEPAEHFDNYNSVAMEGTDSAQITISTSQNTGDMMPSFSLFQDEGKLTIDDVIEGGDTDFFHNNEIQSDYFSLINELRNPGSSNKSKILTLYTARPRKDREQLLKTRKLPINVFLANSYDHVEGLAHDLSSGEPRDVWKVRIDNRYLTQTLDGPVKYYQITSEDVPVLKLELL